MPAARLARIQRRPGPLTRYVPYALPALLACGLMPAARAQTAPAGTAAPPPPSSSVPESPSLFLPPAPRGTGRVIATVRPFFNMLGPGWGSLNEFGVEYYLRRAPLKLFVEARPVAVFVDNGKVGMISQVRVGAGLSTHLIGLDFGLGGRYQRLGPGGFSAGAGLRLGAVDGLFLRLDLTYAIVHNYFTSELQVAFSNMGLLLEVPIHPRASLFLDAGFSLEAWVFANVGLRHHLGPRGAPGTWSLRGGLGLAWVLDRFPCQYSDPRPCEDAAWATGLTLNVGLERHF